MPNQPKSISLWRRPDFDRHKASVAFRRLGLVAPPMVGRNSGGGSNKTLPFWRSQAQSKGRINSLRLLQGCHNWGHNGLAGGRSSR